MCSGYLAAGCRSNMRLVVIDGMTKIMQEMDGNSGGFWFY